MASDIRYTELHRIVNQINWITDNAKNDKSTVTVSADAESIRLDKNDSQEAVLTAVAKLGYDLSEEDSVKVYEEFQRVAAKKNVGAKELDAIVASAALQVPSAYKLISYVINNGNIITASAHIVLERDGNNTEGISLGDGPIDASFIAIDTIIGHHYELDDFQIQAVTEGKEAMGSAVVKLRSGGKLYSGNGISTDIIGASIRAYLNAPVILAYGLFFGCMLLNVVALRTLDLTIASVLEASSYIYVMALSFFFLKEKISLRRLIGNIVIIVGIVLTLTL
jgi:2-isopropylmalate synthase